MVLKLVHQDILYLADKISSMRPAHRGREEAGEEVGRILGLSEHLHFSVHLSS